MLPGMKHLISTRSSVLPSARYSGPDHGSANKVGLCQDSFVWHDPPFLLDANAIMAVLSGFPIDVRQRRSVSVRAAWPLAGLQAIEPRLERGLSVAAVISSMCPLHPREEEAESQDSEDEHEGSSHAGLRSCLGVIDHPEAEGCDEREDKCHGQDHRGYSPSTPLRSPWMKPRPFRRSRMSCSIADTRLSTARSSALISACAIRISPSLRISICIPSTCVLMLATVFRRVTKTVIPPTIIETISMMFPMVMVCSTINESPIPDGSIMLGCAL